MTKTSEGGGISGTPGSTLHLGPTAVTTMPKLLMKLHAQATHPQPGIETQPGPENAPVYPDVADKKDPIILECGNVTHFYNSAISSSIEARITFWDKSIRSPGVKEAEPRRQCPQVSKTCRGT